MSSRQVPLICSGHSRPVPDLGYSAATADGFFIISACLDGKPMLRNGENGDWIGTFEGHKGAVWSAKLNDTASLAVTGSADYTAKIWDAISGAELRSFAHTRIVKAVEFSKDSRRIVTGGQDKLLRVFDVEQGLPIVELNGHQQPIKTVLWSPSNSELILSGGADEVIRVWDLRAMTQVALCSTKAPVASMELSRDGRFLITAAGREVTFWDSQTFVPQKMYQLGLDVNGVSLHPDLTKFVAGGGDFYVHVYDFQTGEELDVHKGHHGPVHCVRFAPDGETFASGSEDGTIRIWQTNPKQYGLWQVQPVAAPPQVPVSSTPPKVSATTIPGKSPSNITPKNHSHHHHHHHHNHHNSHNTPPKLVNNTAVSVSASPK